MTKHSQWEKSASKPQNKEPVVHKKVSSKIFFLNIDEALSSVYLLPNMLIMVKSIIKSHFCSFHG